MAHLDLAVEHQPATPQPPLSRSEIPHVPTGMVRRTALLDWFGAHQTDQVISVVAPAGYGKSTLVAQVAEADRRAFAWISLGDIHNHPVVLMSEIADTLAAIAAVGPEVFEALGLLPSGLWSTALPKLGKAFASIEDPGVLVLDDIHRLTESDALDVVAALSAYVPMGSQLILVGREEPRFRLARLRAERRVARLGRTELALDVVEAGALLSGAGLDLTGPQVAELTSQTEGWAAALYLAALSSRDGAAVGPGAEWRPEAPPSYIADYVRLEVLAHMGPEQREFVMRTSVLERMCGSLCDVVLKRHGTAAMLQALERSNVLLMPLDGRGEWYRYHHLFRALLLNELEVQEPGTASTLRTRAAAWYEQHSRPIEAIEYALAGDDVERAARLLVTCYADVYQTGRLATGRRWLKQMDEAAVLERSPAIAVLGAWAEGLSGRPFEADRLAAVAERGAEEEPAVDGSPTSEALLAALRAGMCRHGIERMRADAELALETTPEWSNWRSTASVLFGISLVLAGEDGRADVALADAAEVAKERGMPSECSVALAERSLLASARREFGRADQLAGDAHRVVLEAGLEEYMTSALTYAAVGRVCIHRRDLPGARSQLALADRLRPLLTHFMPFVSAQVRLELIRERIALGDAAGALLLQDELDRLLRRVPELGVLVQRAGQFREQVNDLHDVVGDVAPLLTDAEQRVLPLLATHLTFAEIAERQYVSRGTIKTQAISIYRKLGVTRRGEAIERAAALGLVDPAVVPPPRDFRQSG